MSPQFANLAARGLRPISELGSCRPHGERLRYLAGCRCLKCRCANSNYETRRAAARRRGEWNGLVDAALARAHILELSRAGVGRRAVAEAADVGKTLISLIRSRGRRRIRAQHERRILGVTRDALLDHATVPARRAWRRIEQLLGEGFTKARLARELGYSTPRIQFSRRRVFAINELKVERLWRRYML